MKSIRRLTTGMLAMLGAAALLFTSCNRDNELPGGGAAGTPLAITVAVDGFGGQTAPQASGAMTRTAISGYATTFEVGDAIGVWAYEGSTAKYSNKKWVMQTGGTWAPADETDKIYYHGTAMTIKAYYPYDATATTAIPEAATFTVLADQSTFAGYEASDLLRADNSWNGSATALQLNFDHAMSMVELEPSTKGTQLQSVTLSAELKQGETATDLKFYPMLGADGKPDGTYRALLPAQTLAAGAVFKYANGDEYSYNLNGKALAAGKYHSYGVTTLPKTITHNGIEMVFIPAGTFRMGRPAGEPGQGNNEAQHSVTLTKDFYMSKCEITNKQYAAFLNANSIGSNGQGSVTYYKENFTNTVTETQTFVRTHSWGVQWDGGSNQWIPSSGKDKFPIINVTWFGAKAFADWIGGTLPTEAQWEYACRGDYPNKATETATKPFGIGTGKTLDGTMANINGRYTYDYDAGGHQDLGTGNGTYVGMTTAVGSYTGYANDYGLYDMHGNVVEWCADWYDGGYGSADATDAVTDPVGSASGSYRVLRGGSWFDYARLCRSAFRYGYTPGFAYDNIGFRVAFVP